jgi:hypothetical protein
VPVLRCAEHALSQGWSRDYHGHQQQGEQTKIMVNALFLVFFSILKFLSLQ